MNLKSYTIAALAGTALLVAIAGTVQLPQLATALLFFLMGLAVTVSGAAYFKNLQTLNLQGRVISGIAELHLKPDGEEALQQIEKILNRMFPRATLYRYPFSGQSGPITEWEPASRLARQSLEESRALIIYGRGEEDIQLPAGIENLAVVPLGSLNLQALFMINIPPQVGPRNLKTVLEALLNHLGVVFGRVELKQQEQQRCETLLGAAVQAMESHQPVFIGHARRVARISRLIGQRLGMTTEELQQLVYAALLHDIGRWTAAPEDEAEMDHASLGQQMIPAQESLAAVKSAVCHHHERYDGSGYPLGLKHTDIPLAARVIAVADIYDALTRLADEEEAYDHDQALAIIKKAIGTQFDPLVVVAFEEVAAEPGQDHS